MPTCRPASRSRSPREACMSHHRADLPAGDGQGRHNGRASLDDHDDLTALGHRVSAARAATEARGETFYPGPSRVHLAAFPPKERWDDWVELSSRSWPAHD